MKKRLVYIGSVFVTLLMTFLIIGLIAAAIVQFYALNSNHILSLVEAKQLPEKVSASLTDQFNTMENTTGIPASIFENEISPAKLRPLISDSIENGFSYIRNERANPDAAPDFSILETNVEKFFIEYAETNNIPQDETFKTALRESIQNAESLILSECDVFQFRKLNQYHYLDKIKPFTNWIVIGLLACILAILLMLFVLYGINSEEYEYCFYWSATAALVGSFITLIPSAYVKSSNWFDRFALKQDQTFAAVTGYLNMVTQHIIIISVIGILSSIILYALFGILRNKRMNKQTINEARH
ncbi:MAG: hypothetical protein MJ071_05760 [Oscillospiraceae bacterium]|nr:hypothetical protein [Oscillospiraceae bacterium]